MKNIIHFSFLEVLYLIQLICCFLFIKYTEGLGYMQGDEFYYTSQLQSSGGEDEVSIFSLGVLSTKPILCLYSPIDSCES